MHATGVSITLRHLIKSLPNPENKPLLCLGSLKFHSRSYYETNTRGVIIPHTTIEVSDVDKDDWEAPVQALLVLDAFHAIERHFINFLATYKSDSAYYRKCATKWDLINKLRFVFNDAQLDDKYLKELYNLISIPESIDYFFDVYCEYLKYRETATAEPTVSIVNDIVTIGEFTYVAKYKTLN